MRRLPCRIHYSERYSDEEYEYRHVILPKPLFKMIPKNFFNPDNSGTLRLLTEEEWRGIGITQSLGWEHYEVHGKYDLFIWQLVHSMRRHALSTRAPCPPVPTSEELRPDACSSNERSSGWGREAAGEAEVIIVSQLCFCCVGSLSVRVLLAPITLSIVTDTLLPLFRSLLLCTRSPALLCIIASLSFALCHDSRLRAASSSNPVLFCGIAHLTSATGPCMRF